MEGLCWRVGNGLSINPYADKWIPSHDGARSLDVENDTAGVMNVSELIDFESGHWNLSALGNSIDDNTREAILSIPLSSNWPVDCLFWLHTQDGRYSVKSGYWLGRLGALNDHSNASPGTSATLWSKLWNLECPPKMRHFLWRACKGSLATNHERFRRHLTQSPLCNRCQREEETTCHALLDCEANKAVWDNHPGRLLLSTAPRTSFQELFSWLVDNASRDCLILIATAMWASWFARNKMIFEESPNKVVNAVVSFTNMVREYNDYASKVFIPCQLSILVPTHWSPPSPNWIKINVDAHIPNGMDRGLGVVCRDDQGNLVAAGVRRVNATWSTAVSELAAAVYGVEVACRLGFTHIHLEGDNTTVFKNISKQPAGLSPFYVLLDRLKYLLNSFVGVRHSVVRRSGNTAAHMVARWNVGSFGDTVYIHPFPQTLVSLVTIDLI